MSINKMIIKEVIFYRILSTHSLKKVCGISVENWYVDIGAQTDTECLNKGTMFEPYWFYL